MQIFAQSDAGPTSTYEVDAATSTTVSDLKAMVENDVFFTGFRLMANGKALNVRASTLSFGPRSHPNLRMNPWWTMPSPLAAPSP